ncbi:MAG: hypothetical protein ACPL6F_01360 [Anaerolineales bacterium]
MINNKKLFFIISIAIISIIFLGPILLVVHVQRAFASVTLIDFIVTYEENQVRLNWNTATEPNNSQFFIMRSDNQNGNFQRIMIYDPDTNTESRSINAKGDSVSGGNYVVFDKQIINGKYYYYKLVAVDLSDHLEEILPTSIINAPKTSTPTTTSTQSVKTPKKTKLSITSTNLPPTATYRIIYPTATPPPVNPSPSATNLPDTPTPSDAPIIVEALPLPSITFIYPDTATAVIEASPTLVAGTIPNNASWFTPQRLIVLGLIVAVWVILGGGFFFILRKIE